MIGVSKLVSFFSVSLLCTSLMGVVSITINTPPTGSGATWDCSDIDGTTTDCTNGSPVSGGLYKWKTSTMTWTQPSGLGPFSLTSTDTAGNWSTEPDSTLGVNSTFSSAGKYKVEATVMDNVSMVSDTDANFWDIP